MILLTGGGGFVGRKLLEALQGLYGEVLPVFRSDCYSNQKEYIQLDLTSIKHLEQLKQRKDHPDTVVHFAGLVDIHLLPNQTNPTLAPVPANKDIASLYMANTISTANLLEYCLAAGVKHLIYASSQTVYGLPKTQVIQEETLCEPLEHYAVSKYCAEQLLKTGSKQDLAVTCLRFPGIYGEGRKSGMVYKLCEAAVKRKEIKVEFSMPLPLDVLHIEDVIEAVQKAVVHGGSGWTCLNISTGEPCNILLLAQRIASLMKDCKVIDASVEQPVIQLDNSRAKEVLGWSPWPMNKRLVNMLESVENEA
ncbi:NAD(P)-dependent oxidoreductase [Halobacillus rhizosphaerae]|uniref:NAD-dependent epimerase/dehydratase family protein n=1 Tax=Halobacillus rhizosphaerae TaxID=3064889 RepID=UPI00398B9EA0